ncbi:hypothetical protein E3A20_02460, partial [Planctomyces bekefii]
TIWSDPLRFRQILLNVVGNAVKFTNQGHVGVHVGVAHLSGAEAANGSKVKLVIRVTDTGSGIEVDKHTKIFEPFSQESAATARRYGGTGLGLTLSRQLARLLGGDIDLIESEPGKGSTFAITVAAGAGAKELGGKKAESIGVIQPDPRDKAALQGLSLLVVDDGDDNRYLMDLILKSRGAAVDLARDGDEAVSMAMAKIYDVIFMDIQMPKLDGRAATEQLRQRGYKGPIVALTAHATSEERVRCMKSGMNEYCTKPISPDEVIRVVLRWARR